MKEENDDVIKNEKKVCFSSIKDEKPHKSSISSGFFFMKECMSRIEVDSGRFVPVTILKLLTTSVLDNLCDHKKVLVAVEFGGKINRPMSGVLKKYEKLNDRRFIKESNVIQKCKIKTVDSYVDAVDKLQFDEFAIGDMLDIRGTSKGKGFQGKRKRHGHSGRPQSHGSSLDHRSGGSGGHFQNRCKTKPGGSFAGRMGHDNVTMQNLQVVSIFKNELGDFLMVKGSVPGPNNSLVYVRRAIKYENSN